MLKSLKVALVVCVFCTVLVCSTATGQLKPPTVNLSLPGITNVVKNSGNVASTLKPTNSVSGMIDAPYKMAAHYASFMVNRALMKAKVPYRAHKAHIVQKFYKKGDESKPLETFKMDLDIKRKSVFSHLITGKGKLNDMDVEYRNLFKFSLSQKGTMEVRSVVDGKTFIELKLDADRKKHMTQVKGTMLGKTLQFLTEANTTKGSMAGIPYNIVVEDIKNEKGETIALKSKGKIGQYDVEGYGEKKSPDHYELEESYGPIIIKTKIDLET